MNKSRLTTNLLKYLLIFRDFPKKNVETIRGFKKTVQNQKYHSTVMKKLCNLHSFFIKNKQFALKILCQCKNWSNFKWFQGKKYPDVKVLQVAKTTLQYTRHIWIRVHFKITIVYKIKVLLWIRVDSLRSSLNISIN